MNVRHARIFSLLSTILPVLLTLLVFVVSLFDIIIPRFEEIVLDRKREMIRELTTTAWHIAERYDQDVRHGVLSLEDAQRRAREQIRNLRYGEARKDYFWITDYRPFMIDHPFRPDLNGKDLSSFRDSRGKLLFVEIVRVVRERGEGYVDYTWQWKDDASRIVPKLSFVKPYAPWGWIIGTGIYIEDVREEIGKLESNIISISVWITVGISLLLLFIAMQNLRSERKRLRAEADLRESKEKYEALVEASTEGMLMILDRSRHFFNKSLLAMTGYSDEEARVLTLTDLFPRATSSDLSAIELASAGENGGSTRIETVLRHRDGSERPALLTVSSVTLFDRSGTVIIIKDMSHHKQITQALDESRERFLALTNRLGLAVLRVDAGRDLRILEGNAAAAVLLGFASAEDLPGAAFGERFVEVAMFTQFREELQQRGMISDALVMLRSRQGSAVQVRLSVTAMKDDQGNVRFYDCVLERATEAVMSEEPLRRIAADVHLPMLALQQHITPFVRELPAVSIDDSADSVLRTMGKLSLDCVFVADRDGRSIGMLTREALCRSHGGHEAGMRIVELMEAPLPRVMESARVYDVLERYFQHGTDCIAVSGADGSLRGAVHVEELRRAALLGHWSVMQRVRQAETLAELTVAREHLLMYVEALIDSGADAQAITSANTQISDIIARKVVDIALLAQGEAPAAFAFMCMGSEGRSEQTLLTDQDNALVIADGASASAMAWYVELGERVAGMLHALGYRRCEGNIMASNPRWAQPLAVWKEYFLEWIENANPQDLLEASIFFDFRHVHGDESLVHELQEQVRRATVGNHAFLLYLSQNAQRFKPPVQALKSGDSVDMKAAMQAVVDFARVYALRHGIAERNTPRRLDLLQRQGVLSPAGGRELAQAYAYMMRLRFRHQLALRKAHGVPNNIIPVPGLTEIDRIVLRRAFALIEDFQGKMNLDFKGTL